MFRFFSKVLSAPKNPTQQSIGQAAEKSLQGRKVLNVGGNNKNIPIPAQYDGWEHVLLDIDPKGSPDVVCDARNLTDLPEAAYDSVYCSHNLEHYYRHDVGKVLTGFLHVLNNDGFAYIRVPDMGELMQIVVKRGLDIDDFLYQSPAGPIAVSDVIYGYGEELERSGNDFFAHKTGFTQKSLRATLLKAGFSVVYARAENLEISAIAFKSKPSGYAAGLFNLTDSFPAESSQPLSTHTDLLSDSAAYKKRGNEFLSQGRLEEAATCYRQAIWINPGIAEAHLNLGFVLNEQRLYDEAKECLKHAIQLNPKMEDAYYLLGTIAQKQDDSDGAIECFSKALALKPDFAVIYRDLCQVLFQSGQYESAKEIIIKGISVDSEFADFHYYLGNLYLYENALEKALSCYQRALSIQPDYAAVHSNIAKVHLELGNIDEAGNWYQKACSLDTGPVAIEATSALLFTKSYDANYTPERYLAEARHFGSKVLAQAKPYTHRTVHPTNSAMRPLRVGLVSGDFRNHPVGFFLESILAHLNPSQIELVAYPTQQEEDDLTARIRHHFAAWNPIAKLSDEAAARKIHEDDIHILIDLAGHSSHNRLPVFAWKPAPVQVSWLGYWATTGVPGMDYLLADPLSVPESHRAHFTETVWNLPDTRLCFTPPETASRSPATPLPVLRNGYITFGCFQNLSKINNDVLALWGRIFNDLPQSRLRIQNKQMNFPKLREHFQQRLTEFGIAPERVTIEGQLPRNDYLVAHAEVDIILDTFPYPGGTTTCEALWMGVPTLTLAGNTMLARQGASLLTCAGLEDWIARDKDDYLTKALAHAAAIDQLAQLRAKLREQVLASPLFDAPLFAKRFEDALQGIWHHAHQFNPSGNHD